MIAKLGRIPGNRDIGNLVFWYRTVVCKRRVLETGKHGAQRTVVDWITGVIAIFSRRLEI